MLPTKEANKERTIMKCIKSFDLGMIDDFHNANEKGTISYSYPIVSGEFVNWYKKHYEYQNLYILSDEKIKKGDWVYDEDDNSILQCEQPNLIGIGEYKIIATTNKSLKSLDWQNTFDDSTDNYLPEPSEGFIKAYIEAYNSGNPITEVDVEYLQYNYPHQPHNFVDHEEIKVNSKDNTITIRKIKDSWNREKIYKLMNKAVQWGRNANNYQATQQEIDNWIKQNL